MQTLQPDQSLCTVEPNQDVVGQLKAAIAATNAPARHFPTLEAALQHEGDGLDLVIAIHVMDHIFDLNELFATLRSRLSRQGMFFMVVHHPGSRLARVLAKRWPPYCLEHPQLLTPKEVSCLARRHAMAGLIRRLHSRKPIEQRFTSSLR